MSAINGPNALVWLDGAMRISLLHATFRAGAVAVAVRDEWLANAADPKRVEHIFACDVDDEVSMACPEIATSVVGAVMDGVSAVRNWNAAAERANGDVLVVMSDDLWPMAGWDLQLESLCGDLDPQRAAFVIKVRDNADDTSELIRHPVISRRYYRLHGLWWPQYEGHLVDNDFTLAAQRRNVVIDGRAYQFDHRDPHHNGAEWSESHRRMLTSQELGREVFAERWPAWKRRFVRRPLVPRPGQRDISIWWRVTTVARWPLPYVLRLVPASVLTRLRGHRTPS